MLFIASSLDNSNTRRRSEEMHEVDRMIANWYTANHPESHFNNRCIAALGTAVSVLFLYIYINCRKLKLNRT